MFLQIQQLVQAVGESVSGRGPAIRKSGHVGGGDILELPANRAGQSQLPSQQGDEFRYGHALVEASTDVSGGLYGFVAHGFKFKPDRSRARGIRLGGVTFHEEDVSL